MVGTTAELSVEGRAFLFAVRFADKTVDLENQFPKRMVPMDLVNLRVGKVQSGICSIRRFNCRKLGERAVKTSAFL